MLHTEIKHHNLMASPLQPTKECPKLAQCSDLPTASWSPWNSEPFSAKTAPCYFKHRDTPRNDGTVTLTLSNILVPGPTLIHPYHVPSYIFTFHLNSNKFSPLAALVGGVDDLALKRVLGLVSNHMLHYLGITYVLAYFLNVFGMLIFLCPFACILLHHLM
jgi:hypothetical protein